MKKLLKSGVCGSHKQCAQFTREKSTTAAEKKKWKYTRTYQWTLWDRQWLLGSITGTNEYTQLELPGAWEPPDN